MKEKINSGDIKNEKPGSKAITTFIAFNLIGLIQLILFIFAFTSGYSNFFTAGKIFIYSSIFTGISFFTIGMIKAKVVNKSSLKSGLSTLIIDGIAAIVAFIVWNMLSTFVSN